MKQKKLFKLSAVILALVMAIGAAACAANAEGTQFTDVQKTDYYYDAVVWAAENGITYGVDDSHYAPAGVVTRAQIVSFLWRMAGEPAPTNTETFADVAADSWYETAVRWAVEQGITEGTGDNQFSPELTCDRAMCLTLLYRMMGSALDEAAAAEPVEMTEDITLEDMGIYMLQQMIEMFRRPEIFPDVPNDAYYELAVVWGGMNEILTDGNTGAMEEGVLFRPTDPCTRAEMISFLYQTKLMQDKAEAPELYENGPVTVAIPQKYSDLVYRNINAVSDEDDGIMITISEKASREAAKAMGQDPDEIGAGELFSIGRVSEDAAQEILSNDIPGAEVFAKDENGKYYVFYHPTDVRLVRETNEQMSAELEQWTELTEWAYDIARDDIIKYSSGLTAVTFGDTTEKDGDKSLDAFVGTWTEKIAGRGTITISKDAASGKATVEASWPDSAFVMHNWTITAVLTEDGTLRYENGKHTVTETDDKGKDSVLSETTDESGVFYLNDAGELIWHDDKAERDGDSTFIK